MIQKIDILFLSLCLMVVVGMVVYAKSTLSTRREQIAQLHCKPTVVKMVPTSVTVDETTGKTNVVIEIVTE